jgi:Protein of unknown function (DUF3341)
MRPARRLYGLMAEFERPDDLRKAVREVREQGYRRLDAYTPLPIDGLVEEMGVHSSWLPLIVLIAGIIGAIGGFLMQYYASVISFPIDIGGRPLNSWPAFIPVTFELTILCAALSAVLGMLALCGLPRPHHPIFNEPRFVLASQNRLFLCIESRDRRFDREATRRLLESFGPAGVYEIEDK